MCKAYTVHFVKSPCTSYCGGQLTTRIRPCFYRGTPLCQPEPNHKINVHYRCAMHFQATVYPKVDAFTEDILTYILPDTTDNGKRITKFDALDQDVGMHIRQFGNCMYVAYQDEYYEAARTRTYMQLHGGALPPGVDHLPRHHGEILRALEAKLRETYARFCDGDRWVRVGVPIDRQPERGQFFYAYPLLGVGDFDQLLTDISQKKVSHYSFADIFDGLGWYAEGRGGSLSPEEEGVGEHVEDYRRAFEKGKGPFSMDDLDNLDSPESSDSDSDSEDEDDENEDEDDDENNEDDTVTQDALEIIGSPVDDDKSRLAEPGHT